MVPAYFAQCRSAFTIGKMRCASASALTAKVTKQPNRSIQITKPTSAAFLTLSAWEEEGEREGWCLLSLSSQGNEGCCAWVRGWWSSESYPTICVTWAASLGVHSSALMTMPGTLFRLFSDSCQTASLSVCAALAVSMVCVCVRVSPLCRLCFTSTSIITVFNCCFYYRISFTFSLVRSLRLAKLVGFSSPPPPLSLPPYPLPTVVHSVFPFSLSLFLSLFFAFVFMILCWQALHAAYLPLPCSLHTFSVDFLHDFPHEQQQQPGMCVCACSTVRSTIAHHIN